MKRGLIINMHTKEDILRELKEGKGKFLVMLAPSFIVDFNLNLISQLRELGFDKIVELTFGAKMVNREYHKLLEKQEDLVITSVCPGIVATIEKRFPQYKKNLARIDSPMIAMAKISRKIYPKHKIVFISPCNFKKIEAQSCKLIYGVMDYKELGEIFENLGIKGKGSKELDRFYNEYTKIYPVSGGLSKTAHLKGILKKGEEKTIDGILEVEKFLNKPDKKIRFLDVTFCKGGCIGGPCVSSPLSIEHRKQRVLDYLKKAEHETMPRGKEGIIKKAEGIKFTR